MRTVGVQDDPSDVAGSGARVHDEERVTNDGAFAMDVSETSWKPSPSRHHQQISVPSADRRTISAVAMAVVEPR
jgi:hypothetical protein